MAKKDKEKKEQKKCEKHEEQRGMVLETLNELSDFCLENIVAIKPLLDDENDAVAACAEDRICKFNSLLEVLSAVAQITEQNADSE